MALPRFARNTIYSSIAGACAAAGNFLGVLLVARLLGPGGAGDVALAIWLTGAVASVFDLGAPLTVSRFLPELSALGQSDQQRAFSGAFYRPVLATTALGALICAFIYFKRDFLVANFAITPFDNQPAAIWLAVGVMFCLQAISSFGLAHLRGLQRFDLAAKLAVVALILQLCAVVVGAWRYGVMGAVAGYSAGSAPLAAYALTRISPLGALSKDLSSRAWRFSISSWAVGLISIIVWSRTEVAFLNHYRGAHDAGLFSVANTLALIAAQAPLLMTGGLLALFSEQWALGDKEKLQDSYSSALRFMALLIFPACFGMAALAPVLMPLLFGAGFAEAGPAAAIIVAGQAFGAISTVTTSLLFAIERNRFLVQIGVVGAIAVLAAGVLVIPAFGVNGAVVSRVLIQFALVAAAFIYIGWRLQFAAPFAALLKIMLAAGGCALIAFGVIQSLPNFLGVALAIACGAISFILIARLVRALPREDLDRLYHLSANLPPWLSPIADPALRYLRS